MKTPTDIESTSVYPTQPIHPLLIERLHACEQRLYDYAERRYGADLSNDLGHRLIAQTLRFLSDRSPCLNPQDPNELDLLVKSACTVFRMKWRKTVKRDPARAFAKMKLNAFADLQDSSGEAWEPSVGMYQAHSHCCVDAGQFPGDDLFAGESGRSVVQILLGEHKLSELHAHALLFWWHLDDFPSVLEALRLNGLKPERPDALRKWVSRNQNKYRSLIRGPMSEWGYGPSNASPDGGDTRTNPTGEPIYIIIYRGLIKAAAKASNKFKTVFTNVTKSLVFWRPVTQAK